MYKGKRFLAVIPARGGSKGIPRKNIIDVNGKPLIAYTIEAANQSKYIDRVIVSTNDEEIAEISRLHGAEVPFLRPEELATDQSKTIEALLHAINSLPEEFDYIMTLQPTQPLRTAIHIDEAIEVLCDKGYTSLASVSQVEENPILIRSIENGILKPLLSVNSTLRRQEFPLYYYVNGAIYINLIVDLKRETSLNDNNGPYLIKEKLIDIDEAEDLHQVRLLLSKQ